MSFFWLLFSIFFGVSKSSKSDWNVSCASTHTADDLLKNANLDLTGKVIVYTGADGNIASQTTLALATANATLMLVCYSVDKCTFAASIIVNATGARVETEQIDLSSQASIRATAVRIIQRFNDTGGIYALVNSAGSSSTSISEDGYVSLMVINTLGPALFTELLLPILRATEHRPKGRVVNVAAAVYGADLKPPNNTVSYLKNVTESVDPYLERSGSYFQLSKYLMIHHSIELARREPLVFAMAVNPGYAIEMPHVPQKLLQLDPKIFDVCHTNFKGLAACPELYEQAAAVIAVAGVWPHPDGSSGSYLDFETKLSGWHFDPLYLFGPYQQQDPTCIPRDPPSMDQQLESDWYDEMLQLMGQK